MKKAAPLCLLILLATTTASAWALLNLRSTGLDMTRSAEQLVGLLSEQQRSKALLEYESPQRVGWHFIPKAERKGLEISDMDERQRSATHALLRAALSQAGYDKTTKIMHLEALLHELEMDRSGGPIRDPHRYYLTLFGKPSSGGQWGLSFEGHHLSLNFAVAGGQVTSSTPQFLGANPAVVKSDNRLGVAKGTRVLADEELLAFRLVRSLTPEQRAAAVIAEKAPREIRNAGSPQPPADPPEGLAAAQMTAEQVEILDSLIETYAAAMPREIADARRQAIRHSGIDGVHFAWAGPSEPGIGHYYRIQGATFLVEFVNTQPDAAGNPANHIHTVWRDMAGDFGIPLSKP